MKLLLFQDLSGAPIFMISNTHDTTRYFAISVVELSFEKSKLKYQNRFWFEFLSNVLCRLWLLKYDIGVYKYFEIDSQVNDFN